LPGFMAKRFSNAGSSTDPKVQEAEMLASFLEKKLQSANQESGNQQEQMLAAFLAKNFANQNPNPILGPSRMPAPINQQEEMMSTAAYLAKKFGGPTSSPSQKPKNQQEQMLAAFLAKQATNSGPGIDQMSQIFSRLLAGQNTHEDDPPQGALQNSEALWAEFIQETNPLVNQTPADKNPRRPSSPRDQTIHKVDKSLAELTNLSNKLRSDMSRIEPNNAQPAYDNKGLVYRGLNSLTGYSYENSPTDH
jgi:dsDNA-binding SOS-regulon protein